MSQAYTQTPYAPSTTYASWPLRVGGYLIDALITGVPATIGAIIQAVTSDGGRATTTGTVAYLVLALVSVAMGVYNRWVLGGRTGQTWGRKVIGIRLVGEQTQQPIGVLKAFVRDLAHIVDSIICYIGWLFPLWDAKRQTIADKLVNTVVVKA